MKKILFLIAITASIQSFGQTISDVFNFTPFTSSRIRSSDSVQIMFQLSTSNPANATIKNVIQTAGPTVKWAATSSWITGANVNYAFWLRGLAPGTYSWTATGVSGSGTTGTQTASVVVIPDPVCPVCPPPVVCPVCPVCPVIPAPRTASSIQININGVMITIPLAGTKITYSDGSTQ